MIIKYFRNKNKLILIDNYKLTFTINIIPKKFIRGLVNMASPRSPLSNLQTNSREELIDKIKKYEIRRQKVEASYKSK